MLIRKRNRPGHKWALDWRAIRIYLETLAMNTPFDLTASLLRTYLKHMGAKIYTIHSHPRTLIAESAG